MLVNNFKSELAAVLRKELNYPCSYGDEIFLEISNDDFERRMGDLVQRIYNVVDQQFPERNENLYIIIRNTEKHLENALKIWKP